MSNPPEAPAPKRIFISSSDHEVKLAELFMHLLTNWGYRPYSYQLDQMIGSAGRTFRRILEEELAAADLVLFLVSREVRWSSWCQAEAGATLLHNKKKLMIPIPPITRLKAPEVVKLFVEFNFHDVKDGFSVDRFGKALNEALETHHTHTPTQRLEDEINTELKLAAERYELVPEKALLKVWKSIDPKCEESRKSIVAHICRSLQSDTRTVTTIDLVGVSLKYSLKLVGEALSQAAYTGQAQKTVRIRLVHMSAHSHILQALRDERDVGFIKYSFEEGWKEMLEGWQASAAKAKITLEEPKRFAIDYIPPQLGILIDGDVLFLGQCAFQKSESVGNYHLLVGECEYFYYTLEPSSQGDILSPESALGREAIARFKAAVDAYSRPHLNAGVVLAWDRDDWIRHLKPEIKNAGDSKVVFISETGSNFEGLVGTALEKCCCLHIYIRDPTSTTSHGGIQRIENAKNKINMAWERTGRKAVGIISYYTREPAYRAVIVGKKVLGFEPYLSTSGNLEPSHAKFVITNPSQQSEHFEKTEKLVLNGILESVVLQTNLDGSPLI
jgi:hypothetical protein